MLTELEPLAVWDSREKSWLPYRPERTAWLEEHGLPADDIYRIEFYLLDGPSARLFCFHVNDEGRRIYDDSRDGPAVEKPRDVPLSDLPPPDLLYL
jgi:hypothetical protein